MSIWIICEKQGDDFRATTYELLSKGRELGAEAGMETVAVAVGADAALSGKLQGWSDRIICVEGAGLEPYGADGWVDALCGIVGENAPALVIFGDSAKSRQVMPRVAARQGFMAVANGSGAKWGGDGFLLTRPVMGGKAYATFNVGVSGCAVIFRLNAFMLGEKNEIDSSIDAVRVDVAADRVVNVKDEPGTGQRVPLSEAQRVVCGGRGMKSEENLKLLEDLADELGGAVGVSRAVVDAGWASHSIQVGKSGKTISPSLYIVAGVSGAVHHTMGMDTAKLVVAINTDPNAPIFKYADYAMVGDALEVLPQMTEELKKDRGHNA